jgi:KaiC/GvpD/RAD55 family RecA-like ATPase
LSSIATLPHESSRINRVPREPQSGQSPWRFLGVDELGADDDGPGIEWVLAGYLARGHKTLMPGIWKSGKTTFITHAVRSITSGEPFCCLQTTHGTVTIVSEEGKRLWDTRCRTVGLTGGVDFLLRPFPMGRPTFERWVNMIQAVAEHARDRSLVIFDSIHNLWGVTQENDNAEQLRWLEPLNAITDAGPALLLAGHPSKAEQEEGRVTRGGGAIAGWVDILMEFRRLDPNDLGNRMRVLTGYSRFEETPQELVVELTGDGYRAVGTRAEVRVSARMDAILSRLPSEPPGISAKEIRDGWSEDRPPSKRMVESDLTSLLQVGRVVKTGEGSRVNPYRWWRLLGTGNGEIAPHGREA